MTTRQDRIHSLITAQLKPSVLQIFDESSKHHVPPGLESHIKLLVVSQAFENIKLLPRQRLINQLLHEEFNRGLHALSLELHTPEEWEARQHQLTTTPACRSGGKRNE